MKLQRCGPPLSVAGEPKASGNEATSEFDTTVYRLMGFIEAETDEALDLTPACYDANARPLPTVMRSRSEAFSAKGVRFNMDLRVSVGAVAAVLIAVGEPEDTRQRLAILVVALPIKPLFGHCIAMASPPVLNAFSDRQGISQSGTCCSVVEDAPISD